MAVSVAVVVAVPMIMAVRSRLPMIMVSVGGAVMGAVVMLVGMIVHVFNQASLYALPYQQSASPSQPKPPPRDRQRRLRRGGDRRPRMRLQRMCAAGMM